MRPANILGTELCPKVSPSIVIPPEARLALVILLTGTTFPTAPEYCCIETDKTNLTTCSDWYSQRDIHLRFTALALHCWIAGPSETPTQLQLQQEEETLWNWVGLLVSGRSLAQYDTLDLHDHVAQFAKSIIPATGNRPWLAITTDWPTGWD